MQLPCKRLGEVAKNHRQLEMLPIRPFHAIEILDRIQSTNKE